MTEREIRKELLAISEDMASYEFAELEFCDRVFIANASIQKVFWMVQGAVNSDEKGFYQEEYGERLAKVEKALLDLGLIA